MQNLKHTFFLLKHTFQNFDLHLSSQKYRDKNEYVKVCKKENKEYFVENMHMQKNCVVKVGELGFKMIKSFLLYSETERS